MPATTPGQRNRGMRIRRGEPSDLPFLREMLYEAAFWHPARPRPGLDAALDDPHIARYLRHWGRAGDVALIATDPEEREIGAAWYRLFDAAEPGYGFIDAATPEITIGVVEDWRGRGVGTALLAALLCEAHTTGVSALSLSVERANTARRLYLRHGFTRVGEDGASWTMLADTTGWTPTDASRR